MGGCGSKSKLSVEEPVLVKQEEPPTEPAEAEPAKTELDSTNTPTSQAAEPDPKPAPTPDPPKPTPAIAKAHEAEEDATAAAELVDRVFAAAIQEVQQAEAMAEATTLVTAALESALFQAESEDVIRAREDNDFGRKISGMWSATTEGVGNFFKVITPRLSQQAKDSQTPPEPFSTNDARNSLERLDTPRESLVPLVPPGADGEQPLVAGSP